MQQLNNNINGKGCLLDIINEGNNGINGNFELSEILKITISEFKNSIISIQELGNLDESDFKQIKEIFQKITNTESEQNNEKNNQISKMIYDTGKERANYDGTHKICTINGIKYFIFGEKPENVTIITKKIGNIYETINPINNSCVLFDENTGDTLGIEKKLTKNNDFYFFKEITNKKLNRFTFKLFKIIKGYGICELITKIKKRSIVKNNNNYYLHNPESGKTEKLTKSDIKGYFTTNTKDKHYKIYDQIHNRIHENIKNDFPIFKHGNVSFAFNGKKLIFLTLTDCAIECRSFEILKTETGKNIIILRFQNGTSSIFDCDSVNNNFNGFFIITEKEILLDEKEFNLEPRTIPDKIKVKGKIRKINLNIF